ncbi:MAG: glycoside hydrolase N-terminal domain-containing protein [Melioribacteraceae bacterium]|nr:glycoside hydrolase N-terminal domain-containing protein [Melioribacteraceae bacterium]
MTIGNGSFGALVRGNPDKEIITLSHERLFLPEYPPTAAPDLGGNMDRIRKLTLQGKGEEAAELAVQLGVEAGIEDLIWTDPLVPACQIEMQSLDDEKVIAYGRSVNYDTGESITAWTTEKGLYHRKAFISRPDDLFALKFQSLDKAPINVKIRLTQLPAEDSEVNSDLEDEFSGSDLIDNVTATVDKDGSLRYTTLFKKKWEGSLKGFIVEANVKTVNGNIESKDGWLLVEDADEIIILSKILLSWEHPLPTTPGLGDYTDSNYDEMLSNHHN